MGAVIVAGAVTVVDVEVDVDVEVVAFEPVVREMKLDS